MQDGPEACLEAGSASWDCSGDGPRGRNIGAAPSGAWSSGPGIHGRGTRDALLCAGPVGRVAGRARPGARLLRVSPAPRSVPAGSARHGTTRLLWRGAGCMGGGRPHSAHRGGCGGVPPDAYAGIRVRPHHGRQARCRASSSVRHASAAGACPSPSCARPCAAVVSVGARRSRGGPGHVMGPFASALVRRRARCALGHRCCPESSLPGGALPERRIGGSGHRGGGGLAGASTPTCPHAASLAGIGTPCTPAGAAPPPSTAVLRRDGARADEQRGLKKEVAAPQPPCWPFALKSLGSTRPRSSTSRASSFWPRTRSGEVSSSGATMLASTSMATSSRPP